MCSTPSAAAAAAAAPPPATSAIASSSGSSAMAAAAAPPPPPPVTSDQSNDRRQDQSIEMDPPPTSSPPLTLNRQASAPLCYGNAPSCPTENEITTTKKKIAFLSMQLENPVIFFFLNNNNCLIYSLGFNIEKQSPRPANHPGGDRRSVRKVGLV